MKYRNGSKIIEAYHYIDHPEKWPQWLIDAHENGVVRRSLYTDILKIETIEGTMKAYPGCYLLKDVDGKVYPFERQIFENSYEPVQESESSN